MYAFWETYGFYIWLLTALGLLGLLGLLLVLWRQLRQAVASYKALTSGVDSAPLDLLLQERSTQIQHHDRMLKELLQRLECVERESVRHVAVIRFNPFDDLGGDQSFVIALLDGKHDGLVLSSIYGRTGTRTYAKSIRAGESSYHLSEEEVAAIAQAQRGDTVAASNLR